MPMRVIAKKRCRAMFEPTEKGERATLNPNLSTRLKPTFFRSGPWAAGWLLLVEEGERRCLADLRGRKIDRDWLYPLGIALHSDTVAKIVSEAGETRAFVPRLIFNAKTLKLCSKIKFATQAQQTAPSRYAVECSQ